MRNLIQLILFIQLTLTVLSCQSSGAHDRLLIADSLSNVNPDSALKILDQVKNPEVLAEEDLMLYSWIQAKSHMFMGKSFMEDTLLLKAVEYYRKKGDESKRNQGYLIEANYLKWKHDYDEALIKLESGIKESIIKKDTMNIISLSGSKINIYLTAKKRLFSCS